MKKRKICFIVLCIILLISVILLELKARNDVPVSKKEIFNEYQSHFEIIKDFMLAEKKNESYVIVYDDYKTMERIVDIYDISQTITEREIESLNAILNVFKSDFSFIRVSNNRVDFYGNGSDMFVYSINGKSPKWFYSRFGDVKFSKERLSKNWYYLHNYVR